jgi:hypothetical protein
MPDKDRSQRVRKLRDGWRADEPADEEPNTADRDSDHEVRRSRTLGSTDRIRAEAPDDLETRRQADQVEREIKRTDPRRRPEHPDSG